MIKELYHDNLTGLFNESYLKDKYPDYRKNNPKARFIMIDLQNFKSINDAYGGYSEGDKALKLFAEELEKNFDNKSIVVRLHGDEFCVLTNYTEKEIRSILLKIDKNLDIKKGNKIKVNFNSGDVELQKEYEDSLNSSTIMLHEAKKKSIIYLPFDSNIWINEINKMKYLDNLNKIVSKGNISHKIRPLFCDNRIDSGIIQLYTRNINGESLLKNDESISKTYTMQELDIKNIEEVTNSIDYIKDKIIILLNSNTLYHYEYILKLLENLSEEEKDKLIFSVDLRNIENRDFTLITKIIKILKDHHIKILLDKCDYSISDEFILNNNFEYIRINPASWKNAMKDYKLLKTLESKVKLYKEAYGSKLIFDYITSQNEMNFLENITGEDSLYAGELLSDETSIQFVKKKK